MPKEGISIYFTIKDGASQVLSTLQDKTKALDKETQELAQTMVSFERAQKGLVTTQTKLKNELASQNKVVKEAQKAFDEYHDELSRANLDKAVKEYARIKTELEETNALYAANKKSVRELTEEIRKGGAAGGGISGIGSDGGISTLAKGIVSGQIGQMFSASLGGAAETLLTSAIGTPTASLISDTVSSAITGAAAGAMFGIPGLLIGGGVGALSGLISGGTKIFEAQDDAFKEYVQEAAETALSDQQGLVETGSTIAGSREQTQVAFAQRLGSDAAAEEYLGRVQEMAARTNYDYDEITGYSKLLLNSYDPEEVFGVLQSLSDATAGLNLSGADVEQMIAGLSRMRTTDKTTQEYLNYFSERGVDVYTALADALEVDKGEIAGMVSKGQVGGVEAAEIILDFIDQEFGGLSEKLAGTYDAMVDNLADAEANLQAKAGEGYNRERGLGVQAQQEWLDEKGDELGDAYAMIGQWQASLENLAEQYEREALDAVMGGGTSGLYADSFQRERLEELAEDYQAALAEYEAGNEEAGARMGELLAEAQVIAQNEYNASEGAQLALQSQLDLAGTIREDAASNEAFWDAGYRKGQEFSKGLADGMSLLDRVGAALSPGTGSVEDIIHSEGYRQAAANGDVQALMEYGQMISAASGGFAYGLDRVPYDGYPALLHEGERVLTASQARAQDAGVSGGVQVSIGSVTIGGGLSTWDIAMEIAKELERAAVAAAPR